MWTAVWVIRTYASRHTKAMLSAMHPTTATAETVSWFPYFIYPGAGRNLAPSSPGIFEVRVHPFSLGEGSWISGLSSMPTRGLQFTFDRDNPGHHLVWASWPPPFLLWHLAQPDAWHGCPHYKFTLPRQTGSFSDCNPIFPQIIILVLLSPASLFLSFSSRCHS